MIARRLRLSLLCLLVALIGSTARAQRAEDDTARARAHFQAGQAFYALQKYAEALVEFRAGYNLRPKPRFLLNIGHCHRKLGQLVEAREAFTRFLAEVPAGDPDRAEARTYLAEVEAELARAPAPPVPTVQPPTGSAQVVLVSPPPPRKRALRHLAWALPLGAAVVVGVALGVYFGTRPGPCDGASLACVSAVP